MDERLKKDHPKFQQLHYLMRDFTTKELVAAVIGQAAVKKDDWWFENLSFLYGSVPTNKQKKP